MRTFIDGNGNDSTAAVLAYLATNRQLQFADLYVINTAPQYSGQYLGKTFLLTDYAAPLKWNYKGMFRTAVVSRGEVESKIGLEADVLEVTWAPRTAVLAKDSGGNVILTALQGFGAGIFDNGILEVWRCLMPSTGDCNTFGACCMFAGRIGDLEPNRLAVKISVISRLENLNVQVPLNVVEPGNVLAQYSPGILPTGAPPSLTIAAGSTLAKVYADAAGSTPIADLYDGGYLIFTSGKLAGHYVEVESQDVGAGHWTFYLQIPLPFAPSAADTIAGYIPVPTDYATASSLAGGYNGFPYVPVPIDSAMLIC